LDGDGTRRCAACQAEKSRPDCGEGVVGGPDRLGGAGERVGEEVGSAGVDEHDPLLRSQRLVWVADRWKTPDVTREAPIEGDDAHIGVGVDEGVAP
jgi:hypothetical protein